MIRFALVLSATSLWISSGQAGDMVKWVDKEGKVHYSDHEPTEDVKSITHLKKRKQLTPLVAEDRPAGADGEPREARPRTPTEQAADFRERQVKKAEAEVEEKKKADEVAMKEKNCMMARNQAKQLDAGGRFTYAGPSGESLFMDEKQIEQAKVEAKTHVDAWCKG